MAGEAGRADLAFNTALAKSAGHQNGVVLRQARNRVVGDGFRIHMLNFHAHMVLHAGVAQGFVDRLVAV